jgi:hypothetical protein
MGDGAYDSAAVYQAAISRNLDARVIVPPGRDAVPGPHPKTTSTQRDGHVLAIQARGRTNWQSASGYTTRSKLEAAISRTKGIISETLRSCGNAQ